MRILLIEDDKDLCDFIAFQLKAADYDVDICNNGQEAGFYIDKQIHSLVILDRMLPGTDGLTILNAMRSKGNATPVIMVTAMNSISDRIDGLDAGADDYLVKPFAPEELFARIRALVRRPPSLDRNEILHFKDLFLDPTKRTLTRDAKTVELSKKEMDLLEVLIKNKNHTLTRELLLNQVWGPDSFVEDGNLDNYVYFLRRRLKNINSQVTIKTIRYIGYCIED